MVYFYQDFPICLFFQMESFDKLFRIINANECNRPILLITTEE
jgi:hypothetical protein